LTVKVPLAKLALPARPTEPTSPLNQPEVKLVAAITVKATVVEFVKLTDVPVTATVAVPVVAVPLAIRVRVLEAVAGFGLNEAVTPLGRPDADKVTPLAKPFCGVTVMVLVPPVPCETLKLLGDAERVNFGPAFTFTETAVLLVKPPTVPVAVTENVPVAAVLVAVRVRVLEAVAGFGLNEAVTPLGRPNADKLTLLLKPFCGVTVILLVPLAPCATLTLLGDAESAKFPTTVTSSVVVVELLRLPEVPVIVRVTIPVAAVLLAVRVRVLEAVAGFGLNEALTPLGRPETDKPTLPLKPFCRVTPIVLVTLAPWVRLKLLGDAESVKPGVLFGQLLTRFAALMLPIPVAKSHPVAVPYAGR
jgi:hypothetical protein